MKFANVSDIYHHAPRWEILVESADELLEWYENQTHAKDGFRDLVSRLSKGNHATSPIGSLFEKGCHVKPEYQNKLTGVVDYVHDVLFTPKLEMLRNGESILINSNGGFCNLINDYHNIYEIVEREPNDWPDPTGDIRFLQWSKYGHWYVKVGSEDVIVDGEMKWDTKRQAQAALNKFIRAKTLQHTGEDE